jgi:hypothetical protein
MTGALGRELGSGLEDFRAPRPDDHLNRAGRREGPLFQTRPPAPVLHPIRDPPQRQPRHTPTAARRGSRALPSGSVSNTRCARAGRRRTRPVPRPEEKRNSDECHCSGAAECEFVTCFRVKWE